MFSWRVAEGHSNEEIVEILKHPPAGLPVIKHWEVGSHQGGPGDNGDPFGGVLITDFNSWEDLDAWPNDPLHVDVVEHLLPRFSPRRGRLRAPRHLMGQRAGEIQQDFEGGGEMAVAETVERLLLGRPPGLVDVVADDVLVPLTTEGAECAASA